MVTQLYTLHKTDIPIIVVAGHGGHYVPPDISGQLIHPTDKGRHDAFSDIIAKCGIDLATVLISEFSEWCANLNRQPKVRDPDKCADPSMERDRFVRLHDISYPYDHSAPLWDYEGGIIPRDELERRIAEYHRPFHKKIEDIILEFFESGRIPLVLVDIHTTRNSPYEITIGDALGENCSSSIIEDDIIPIFKNIFSEGGLRSDMIDQMIGYSATEDPSNPAYRYRGGYITNRYGAASTGDMGMTGISAFQIEVNRTTCEEAPDLVTNLFTRFFSELHEHREEIFLPTVRRL